MKRFVVLLVGVLVGLLGKWCADMYDFLGFEKDLTPFLVDNKGKCVLHEGDGDFFGSEDVVLGKFGYLFVTQGDLHECFEKGSFHARVPGSIRILQTNRRASGSHSASYPRWTKAEIEPPLSGRFHPHGMYLSNRTDTLYAINHAGNVSSIEVFDVVYAEILEKSASEDRRSPSPKLRHRATLRADVFPLYGINDVVEGAFKGEVYVTQWLPFGFPSTGKSRPSNIKERIQVAGTTLVTLAGLRLTRVFRCVWSSSSSSTTVCVPATSERFVGANGITINTNRTAVFVNDPARRLISVFRRHVDTGALSLANTIALPDVVDNVEYVEEDGGSLIMGSIPILHVLLKNDKLSLEEMVPVPGGIIVATPDREMRPFGSWHVRRGIVHDGTMLSQISAVARVDGDRVFFGSPYSSGVLECSGGWEATG